MKLYKTLIFIILSAMIILAVGFGINYINDNFIVLAKTYPQLESEIDMHLKSAHSKFECQACHVEKARQLSEKKPLPVENSKCLGCHSTTRSISLGGDLDFDHQSHTQKNVSCANCHTDIAHRGEIKMGICMQCHNNTNDERKEIIRELDKNQAGLDKPVETTDIRMAPTECEACHKELAIPKSHDEDSFDTSHGKKFIKSPKKCVNCHQSENWEYPSNDLDSPTKDSPMELKADWVRHTEFCKSCHTKRPETHKYDMRWPIEHNRVLKTADQVYECLVCHDVKKKPDSDPTSFMECGVCHEQGIQMIEKK